MQNKDNSRRIGFMQSLKNTRNKSAVIVLGILGICLILFSGAFSSKGKVEDTSTTYYSSYLEERVENLLLQIEEIETVSVLITLENSGKTIYAQNSNTNSTEYVLYSANDGQSGLKIAEINPQVRGVAVVCNNGNNVSVQTKIISIISSALGIPTNRITVCG